MKETCDTAHVDFDGNPGYTVRLKPEYRGKVPGDIKKTMRALWTNLAVSVVAMAGGIWGARNSNWNQLPRILSGIVAGAAAINGAVNAWLLSKNDQVKLEADSMQRGEPFGMDREEYESLKPEEKAMFEVIETPAKNCDVESKWIEREKGHIQKQAVGWARK